MASVTKLHDHPTRGELRAYLEHIEANKLIRAAGPEAELRETIAKVHTWLWRVAAGEARRSKAA